MWPWAWAGRGVPSEGSGGDRDPGVGVQYKVPNAFLPNRATARITEMIRW